MSVDRGEIDAQLREIGESDRWWEHREFRDLTHILHPGEIVRGVARGKLLGAWLPRIRPGVRWLMVATDQRILFLRHGGMARRQVEVIPGQIIRARTSSRISTVQILLETAQRTYRLRIAKEQAYRFGRAIDPLMPKTVVQWLDSDAAAAIPGRSALASLPGMGRVAGMLAPPAPPAEAVDENRMERLETSVERLQGEVERLQQQVAFLEDLLRQQAEGRMLEPSRHGD